MKEANSNKIRFIT